MKHTPKHRRDVAPQHIAAYDTALPRWVTALAAGAVVLWLLGSFFPALRVWGFHHAAFLPLWWNVSLAAVLLLVLLPAVRMQCLRLCDAASRSISGWGRTARVVLGLVLVMVAGLVLYLFAMPASLLGDSYLYTSELARIVAGKPIRDFSYHSLVGPLVFFRLGAALIHFLRLPESYTAFHILTAAFGAAYVGSILHYARRASRDPFGAIFLGALLFGCAATIFFFGYIEFYAPLAVAVVCFALALHLALTRGSTLVPSTLWFLVAVACHFSAVAMLPALLWAYVRRFFDTRGKTLPLKYYMVSLAGAVLLSVIVYVLTTVLAVFDLKGVLGLIPLTPTAEQGSYTLFSAAHLADLPNIVLLTGGMAPLLILVLAAGAGGRVRWENAAVQVAGVHVLSWLLVALYFNPLLGMARDWDIYAPMGIALVLFAHAMFDSLDVDRARRAASQLVLAVLALCLGALWLAVNVRESSSVERYTTILSNDAGIVHPDFTEYGFQNLSKHYSRREKHAERIRALRQAVEVRGYPWDIHNFALAVKLVPSRAEALPDVEAVAGLLLNKSVDSLSMSVAQDAGPRDSTEYVADQLVRLYMEGSDIPFTAERIETLAARLPVSPQAELLQLLRRSGPAVDHHAVIQLLGRFENTRRGSKPVLSNYLKTFAYANIATVYITRKQADSACVWYQRYYAIDSTFLPLLNAYAFASMRMGEGARAARLLTRARDLDPSFADTYYNAALCFYFVYHDKKSARREIDAYLARSTDPNAQAKAQQLLRVLEQNP
ncbi:MAG: hypothetical protein HY962_14185 [Ignavibacteriae bacterium]|nr:hypothetical protein [Ignavibacteriota bacterium]